MMKAFSLLSPTLMPFHFWLSKLSTGASFLDALHHDCSQTLLLLSYSVDREFKAGYDTLVRKFERTFRTEERWMEEMDFPELKQHREQHAGILATLHQGQAQIMSGDLQYGREIIEKFLPQWLLLHSSAMDAALANELALSATA